MRDLKQIVEDNGGDNTPALDTHNLTGRSESPPKRRIRDAMGNLGPARALPAAGDEPVCTCHNMHE